MIRFAFKEWAVICRALGEGRQALILRKGGIAEDQGVFRPEHSRFWLYPTYAHQQRDGIKPEAMSLFEASERDRPSADRVRLSHFVEVTGVSFVDRLDILLSLDALHLWSTTTILKRFEYGEPGIFALAARVYRLATPVEVPHRPEFDGCKSWIEFNDGIAAAGAVPVLDDRRYADFLELLDGLLNPTAYA